MAADFLSTEQKEQYGKFNGIPNDLQLACYFHLDKTDKAFISSRRGKANKLGLALELTSVRFLGCFTDMSLIPIDVQCFVAKQLEISDFHTIYQEYSKREPTKREHRMLIKEHYHYYELSDLNWNFKLSRLLYARSWISNERPSLMFDFATAWLIQHKILLPGVSTLIRLISEIRERTNTRLFKRLACLPDEYQKQQLKSLLKIPDGLHLSSFERLKYRPTHVSSTTLKSAINRYIELKTMGIHSLNLKHIPLLRLKNLSRYASITSMYSISRMSTDRQIAILVAFVYEFEKMALDDALDIFDMLITHITTQAKKVSRQKRLRTLKDLDESALLLAEVCRLILDEENIEINELRNSIFDTVNQETLAASIATVKSLATSTDYKFQDEMIEQYGRVRRFLPYLLQNISFESSLAGEAMLRALNYLCEQEGSSKKTCENAPLEIITKPWKRLVMEADGKINKQAYTLCILEQLQDKLRRRDIYVENCEHWSDPRKKLLSGTEWEQNKLQICRTLGHSIDSEVVVKKLTATLHNAYQQVLKNFSKNTEVNIENTGDKLSLTITSLDKLAEPESLQILRQQVSDFLPAIDLTELLLEINEHTGFTREFTHISEANSRADNLDISLCAILLSEACNIGIEPFIKQDNPALTRHRLNWVKQNYIRVETLTAANNCLVNHHTKNSLAQQWGDGNVASADGMRLVSSVKTINSAANKKYFGSGRGITWYNFISDQFSGFHGIVVSGTLRDSIFVLEGLLEQQTGLNPTEIMTDTAGSSDMIFGLFWLLGYQFSPRLADAGESSFWRIETEADYGVLNDLVTHKIKMNYVIEQWEDMLRIAGSLKLGKIQASQLIRSLLKSEKPSSLARGIIEVGRINKTIYLLNYIDNKNYRRRILTQLNRGEGRHAVARIIAHGQRGEISKRYREGQEDQLGALGLVTNAVVLWNTLYMESALKHIQDQGELIKKEDVSRLSPLQHSHINVLGHYSFKLTDTISRGKLRPLNIKTKAEN